MMEEDLTLRTFNDAENHQSLLYGIGDQHLDVVVSKLFAKYKVEIVLSKPRIPYRERSAKRFLYARNIRNSPAGMASTVMLLWNLRH